jgi:hypothetical protein
MLFQATQSSDARYHFGIGRLNVMKRPLALGSILAKGGFKPFRVTFSEEDNIPRGQVLDCCGRLTVCIVDGRHVDRTASPSRWTVQAPQAAMPQPDFVLVSPSSSRRYQGNGVHGSPFSVWVCY